MPQYRKLHVKTVESLDINELPDDFTRLMWVLLPLGLDREGRGFDHPGWIRSKIFPLRDDVSSEMIAVAMEIFCDRGMAVRYCVDNRRYFFLPTFRKYQGETKRESPSVIPGPDGPDLLTSNSGLTLEQVVSKSRLDADAEVDVDSDSDADAEVDADDPPPPFFGESSEQLAPVEFYSQATNVKPNKTQAEEIERAVTDPIRWQSTVKHWLMHSWKADNIVGILDLYGRGGPDACKCRQNGNGPPGKPALPANGRRAPTDDELRAQGYTVR